MLSVTSIALSAFLGALPFFCAAQEGPPASLVHRKGEVSVVRAGQSQPAQEGSALLPGDTVQTGEGSVALLSLGQGIMLKMKERSSFALEGLTPGEGERPLLAQVELKLGALFAKITRKGVDFKLRTGGAVAAVRGTEFFSAYGRERGKKGKDFWLCVREGRVSVESLRDKSTVTVEEGEGILLEGGGKITPPKAYDWTKELNWNMDPEKGDVTDASSLEGAYADLLDQDYE